MPSTRNTFEVKVEWLTILVANLSDIVDFPHSEAVGIVGIVDALDLKKKHDILIVEWVLRHSSYLQSVGEVPR
jgi:hypothetical protein